MTETPDLPSIFFYIIYKGLPTTLLLTGVGLLIGLVIGLLLALMRIYGGKELMTHQGRGGHNQPGREQECASRG